MAFEKLAPYIDFIEQGFQDKKSPRAIANELGQPGLYSTINRYKAAVWGMKDLVGEAKEERANKHDEKHDHAVQEVVSTLELIELGKLRAKQLMSVNLGEEFDVSDGQKHKLTLGSASIYWPTGMQMARDAAKMELELAGEMKPEVNVTIQNEIKLDDILKEYYGSEDAPGRQDSEGDDPGESVHSAQTHGQASPIPDGPKA